MDHRFTIIALSSDCMHVSIIYYTDSITIILSLGVCIITQTYASSGFTSTFVTGTIIFSVYAPEPSLSWSIHEPVVNLVLFHLTGIFIQH